MSISLQLLSTYNLEFLGRLINGIDSDVPVEASQKLYGQEMQQLLAGPTADYTLLWAAPEAVLPSFADAVQLKDVNAEALDAELDAFCDAVIRFSEGQQATLVASFEMQPGFRGYGLLDLRPGLGIQQFVLRLNLRMLERFADHESIYVLDVGSWMKSFPGAISSAKLWYAAKTPFSFDFQKECASRIHGALRAATGRYRRLVVLDLDNTLWGGVIGEVGWEGVELGGHGIRGEAFRAFQEALMALRNRGVQLALCSKNDERVALEAFEHHTEMAISVDDLAGWRINWHDKAANIEELMAEIGLGLDAAVFLDDNPAERARVRETLPKVFVPELPADPVQYRDFLWSLDCFDTRGITTEDRSRGELYVQERKRRDSSRDVGDLGDWLKTLETVVRVDPVGEANFKRVHQLLNKTNQFNLRTRRMTHRELEDWLAAPGHEMWAFSSEDRFGSAGLIGVASIEIDGDSAEISDFLMSCRVMGRKVEEAMLSVLIGEAVSAGAATVRARYEKTERNRPTLDFLDASQLAEDGADSWTWSGGAYPAPDTLSITVGGEETATTTPPAG